MNRILPAMNEFMIEALNSSRLICSLTISGLIPVKSHILDTPSASASRSMVLPAGRRLPSSMADISSSGTPAFLDRAEHFSPDEIRLSLMRRPKSA
jgi:hypothetical protein